MMMNLFTIFDPVSSVGFNANWWSIMVGVLFLPMSFWILSSRVNSLVGNITISLSNEMNTLLGGRGNQFVISLLSFFFFIFFVNVVGLLPYIFTASSHVSFTLSLALPVWLGFMLYGWCTKTNHMFAHLVPEGTPSGLMFFMVIIESVSIMIRPVTLAVRLAANIIAGHLLLALVGGAVSVLYFNSVFMVMMVQFGLYTLEIAVAMIQAYVFSVLVTLYLSEI